MAVLTPEGKWVPQMAERETALVVWAKKKANRRFIKVTNQIQNSIMNSVKARRNFVP